MERVETIMNRVSIEIRAAEGGEDAKLLVVEQAKVYRKFMERRGL